MELEGHEDVRVSVGKQPVSMTGRELREGNGGGWYHSTMYIKKILSIS